MLAQGRGVAGGGIGKTVRVTAREMTPDEAAALVRPVDVLGLGLGPANPHGLLAALSRRTDWTDLTVGGGLILGPFELFLHPGVHYRSGFFGPAEQFFRAAGGDVQLIPAGFRQFAPALRRLAPRVMMVQATPPDYRGFVNLSLHHGATADELRRAGEDPERLLVVEVTGHLPRTRALEGYPNEIHVDDIDVLVATDEHPYELPVSPRTEVDEAIARVAAAFIPDDATLQTGIGGVPSIVAEQLAGRPEGVFGVHSEMFTDGLWRLHLAGKVRNQHKGIFDGVSVTTFALGSRGLYEWLDGNEEVAFGPVHVVNDPTIIGENRAFVSINGALSVDLFGQIVADAIGGRQISGVGGHEDFVAGAELSLDAVSLICLPSTVTVGGQVVSRFAPELPAGSIVSTPRHHTAVVVTEFGAADLRDRTVAERARLLAGIAHPQFRDDLLAAADRLGR
jgi:acyl-CoA hydrolase